MRSGNRSKRKVGSKEFRWLRAEDKDADETDWDDEDDDENEEGDRVDVNMDEAPPLIDIDWMPKKKAEPEVDEEGFTKVVGKKKK